jgi:hypothetical protein
MILRHKLTLVCTGMSGNENFHMPGVEKPYILEKVKD